MAFPQELTVNIIFAWNYEQNIKMPLLKKAITIAERYMENIYFVQKALRAKAFDKSNFLSVSGP